MFDYPVVIIGAGPVGLIASLLLSKYRVHHVLVDENTSLDEHPQAHFINYRSMEIMREIGHLDQEIESAKAPLDQWRRFVYCTKWTGLRVLNDVQPFAETGLLGLVDHFATAPNDDDSPARVVHLPQNKLMRLFFQEADSEFAFILQGYRARIEENAERANVILRHRQTGLQKVLKPRFVLCADGAHSMTRRQFNIDQTYMGSQHNLINVHFLSHPLGEELRSHIPAMLYFTYSPAGVAILVAHDLDRGEFVLQVPYYPPYQLSSDYTQERCVRLIQKLAGRPVEVEIQSIRSWIMRVGVVSRFRSPGGHCFLMGDAAHQFTPAGGYGMNTGIQDAHNLAWKIATALRFIKSGQEKMSEPLLASYGTERRPVALKTAALSLGNFHKTLTVPRAMGLNPAFIDRLCQWIRFIPVSQHSRRKIFNLAMRIGLQQVDWLKGDNLIARYRKRALDAIFKDARNQTLQLLFPGHDIGIRYGNKHSVEPNGSRGLMDAALTYAQKLEIGARAPHFWIERYDSGPISTLDLPSLIWQEQNTIDKVLIIYGDIEWAQAKFNQDALSPIIRYDVVTIGPNLDPACKMCFRFHGTKPAFLPERFAMLMRPDGYIEWLAVDDGFEV